MKATIVMAVRIDHPSFEVYLENLGYSLKAASIQPAERLLVDYGSSREYVGRIQKLAGENGFRYLRAEGYVWSRSRALNVGIRAATGDYIFFVDADCVVPPNYVEEHLKVLNGSTATYSPVYDTTAKLEKSADYAALASQSEAINRSSDWESTRNTEGVRMYGYSHLAISRVWFEENGGLDEAYSGWGREDDHLHCRLERTGVKKVVVKTLPIHLYHPSYRTLMAKLGKHKLVEKLVQKNGAYLSGEKEIMSTEANYGLISITINSLNQGNNIIEHSLLSVLGLPEPRVKISMFRIPTKEQIDDLNRCGFVLLPGSTILARGSGQSEALACLKDVKVPIFCVGASGWSPAFPMHDEAMKIITPPIGCRDPQTYDYCRKLGLEAILTGCQSTYVEKQDYTQPGIPYTVIGFARGNRDWQLSFFGKLKKYHKLVASLQEPNIETGISCALTKDYFTYENPEKVIEMYAKCSMVYTGRLHSILPAMSQGKPVCFFGDKKDSRFTLLDYLGIPVHDIAGEECYDLVPRNMYYDRVEKLKRKFFEWAEKTVYLVYRRIK